MTRMTGILWALGAAVAAIGLVSSRSAADGPAAPEWKKVHFSDFEENISLRWSTVKVEKAPSGKRQFLGRVREPVTLRLEGLPDHRYVRVTFDLVLVGYWQPGEWQMRGGDRQLLVTGTFSTNSEVKQSWPGPASWAGSAGGTGARETGTLGYASGRGGSDAVYPIEVVFGHQGKDLELGFGTYDRRGDSMWGLDNVRVEVLEREVDLPEARREQLWALLDDADLLKARAAANELTPGGAGTARWIASRLKGGGTDDAVQKKIADLDAEDWKTREQATKWLLQRGPAALAPIETAIRASESAEVRARLREIRDEIRQQGVAISGRHAACLDMLQRFSSEEALAALGVLRDQMTESQLRAETGAAIVAMAQRIVVPLVERANAFRKEGMFSEAIPLYTKAHTLGSSCAWYGTENVAAALEYCRASVKVAEQAAALEAKVRAAPADAAVRRELVGLLMRELGAMDRALEHARALDGAADAATRQRLELSLLEPAKLTSAQAQEMAVWYEALATEATAMGKPLLMKRAIACRVAALQHLSQARAEQEKALEGLRAQLAKVDVLDETWVDVLAMITVDRRRGITRDDSGLRMAIMHGQQPLTVPLVPEGSYELRATLTPANLEAIVVRLPTGELDMAAIIARKGEDESRIVQPSFGQMESRPVEGGFVNSEQVTLLIRMTAKGAEKTIEVFLDDKPLMDWTGKVELPEGMPREFVRRHQGDTAGQPEIRFAGYNGSVSIRQLQLRMLSGKARKADANAPQRDDDWD